MQLPDNVFLTLQEVCDAYPYPVVVDSTHLGEILNFVAWRHRADGWGLSRKNGGTNVYSPVGYIAEDILQLPNGHHFDVFEAAGEGFPLKPKQGSSIGIINAAQRPWVAPVEFTPSWLAPVKPPVTVPPTTPIPVPPPVAPSACKFVECDCADAGRLEELAAHFDRIGAEIIQRLGALESRPTGGKCVFQR